MQPTTLIVAHYNGWFLGLMAFFFVGIIALIAIPFIVRSKKYQEKMTARPGGKEALENIKKTFGITDAPAVQPAQPTKRIAVVGGILAVAALLFWLSSFMLIPFFEFTRVDIDSNNNWILKDGWNITLATIPNDLARRTEVWKVNSTFYSGSNVQETTSHQLYIVTNDRVYHSASNDEDTINNIADDLDGRTSDNAVLADDVQPADYLDLYDTAASDAIYVAGGLAIIAGLFSRKKTPPPAPVA